MDGRGNPYPLMNGPYWEHAHSGHPFWHVVLFVLLALVAVAAVVYLVRLLMRPRPGVASFVPAMGGPSAEALNIARLRYARGEIARDEFLRMSADFGVPSEPPPPATPAVESADAPTAADEPAPPDSPTTS